MQAPPPPTTRPKRGTKRGRAPWTRKEEQDLVAAMRTVGVDFDKVLAKFPQAFPHRTPKSLRARALLLKRRGEDMPSSCSTLDDEFESEGGADSDGDEEWSPPSDSPGSEEEPAKRRALAPPPTFLSIPPAGASPSTPGGPVKPASRRGGRRGAGGAAPAPPAALPPPPPSTRRRSLPSPGGVVPPVAAQVGAPLVPTARAAAVPSSVAAMRRLPEPARPVRLLTRSVSGDLAQPHRPERVSDASLLILAPKLSGVGYRLDIDPYARQLLLAASAAGNQSATAAIAQLPAVNPYAPRAEHVVQLPPGVVAARVASREAVSPADSFTRQQLVAHVTSLRVEAFVRRFRPLVLRLIEHSANGGVFNQPVDHVALGIPLYPTIVKHPMDLGTIRSRLDDGHYSAVPDLVADVRLVFANAMAFNPPGHPVFNSADLMADSFETYLRKMANKLGVERLRRAPHSCTSCQAQTCILCGMDCTRYSPPTTSCDCCGERIRRSAYFFRSGAGNRWCPKCVSNGGQNCKYGGIKPPRVPRHYSRATNKQSTAAKAAARRAQLGLARSKAANRRKRLGQAAAAAGLTLPGPAVTAPATAAAPAPAPPAPVASAAGPRAAAPPAATRRASPRRAPRAPPPAFRLEKRRNDDVAVESWAQCSVCRGWMHQICALLNARKQSLLPSRCDLVCPLCVLEAPAPKAAPAGDPGTPVVTSVPSVSCALPAPGPSPAELVPPAPLPAEVAAAAPKAKAGKGGGSPAATAADLPHTRLSRGLEARIRARMAAEADEQTANSLIVRVVSSTTQRHRVPPAVRELLRTPRPSVATTKAVLERERAAAAPVLAAAAAGTPVEPATSGTDSEASPVSDSDGGEGEEAETYSPGEVATEYPAAFPFRQRVILLWQRIDNVDVCLVGVYVQEYGADCPPPNTRRVYLAYLDSVRYLRPVTARTAIYHELLAAYFDSARQRGFVAGHIWSCPPQRDAGYVFHRHPPQQRTPDKKRLRAWYMEMLGGVLAEGVATRVESLFDAYFTEDLALRPDVGLPPMFSGDFWLAEAQKIMRNLNRPSKGKGAPKPKLEAGQVEVVPRPPAPPRAAAAAAAAAALAGATPSTPGGAGVAAMRSPPTRATRQRSARTPTAGGPTGCPAPAAAPTGPPRPPPPLAVTGADAGLAVAAAAALPRPLTPTFLGQFDLLRSCATALRNIRSEFLVIHFAPPSGDGSMGDDDDDDDDGDDQVSSEFFDTRAGFLRFCQGNNYQFDALRRAKHTSTMVLYSLNNPHLPAFARSCDVCQVDIHGCTRHHCDTCEDFDVCDECVSLAPHPHPLTTIVEEPLRARPLLSGM